MLTRALIVDDFPLARDGLRAWLEADPQIEVVGEAGDGDAGLALADELRPDVVLVDMTMPGLSGAALVGRLCHEVPTCKPLVVSADERPEVMLDAIAAGAWIVTTPTGARGIDDLPTSVRVEEDTERFAAAITELVGVGASDAGIEWARQRAQRFAELVAQEVDAAVA